MLWLSLALSSAVLLGFYEVARKAAVTDNAVLPVLLVANLGGLFLLLLGLSSALLFPEWAAKSGLSLHTLTWKQHASVIAKACIVTTSWVLAYVAVKHLPISIAGPLRSMSPIVTVIGALILFRERPSSLQWLGLSIILLGYLSFAWLGRKEGISFRANRWIYLLLLGTVVGATSGLYDKHLLQGVKLDPSTLQLWFTVYNVALQSVLVVLLWWRSASRSTFRFRWQIPLVGALLVFADQFYFRALAQDDALVSIVALVRRTSVVISFTLGGLLFRERFLSAKSGALLILLCGVLLLFL